MWCGVSRKRPSSHAHTAAPGPPRRPRKTHKRVVAVWDGGTETKKAMVPRPARQPKRAKKAVRSNRGEEWDGGPLESLADFARRLKSKAPDVERFFLLVIFVAMVWWGIDVALRIIAGG
jgi:hypothetical protein